MPSLGSLIKLFNVWEIQQLVLLSFTLQIFLFFSGSLRRHSTSMFLSLSIWAAYLGADFVTVYTLSLISRHDEDISVERPKTQPLAFFWAPFLLIHLGGQDTITAFAMEDNNLWLRHLLNLVVQAGLAIYVFGKSIGRHSLELLVSGIFVFIVGIIKYGERIWSLKCGSFKSLESSTGHRYKKAELLGFDIEEGFGDSYDGVVRMSLLLMPLVHDYFSRRSSLFEESLSPLSMIRTSEDSNKLIMVVSITLSVMYTDLYTKALVVRTRSVIIFRCTSQISAVVAFALFHANDKQRYSKIDSAITYSLFIGGFFLELCAVFIFMMSPWTWAWLKARKCHRLARLSWYIFCSDIGWPAKKQLWPKTMGQYILLSWLTGSGQVRTFNQRVMTMVKWFVDLVGIERKNIFWMSKLLDTEYVDVDIMTMECVAKEICHLRDEVSNESSRKWPIFLGKQAHLADTIMVDFGGSIVMLHVLTEKHLSKYPPSAQVEVCRKLSNYMMYLLANHPSMLPLNASAEAVIERVQDPQVLESLFKHSESGLQPSEEALQEFLYIWARLLIYAAGKSRAEMHAAQLGRGRELITFVWLLMSLYGIGEFQRRRIRITNAHAAGPGLGMEEIYVFRVPAASQSGEASGSLAVEITE